MIYDRHHHDIDGQSLDVPPTHVLVHLRGSLQEIFPLMAVSRRKKKCVEIPPPELPYNDWPFCPVCQCDFFAYSPPEFFLVNPETKPDLFPAADIENMVFWQHSACWTLYRMSMLAQERLGADIDITIVIYYPNSGEYHLTGVTQLDKKRYNRYTAPLDPQKGALGIPKNDRDFVSPTDVKIPWDDVGMQAKNSKGIIGFLIHPYCWRLVQMCLREDLQENRHLEVISRVLQSRCARAWTEPNFFRLWTMMNVVGEMPAFLIYQAYES